VRLCRAANDRAATELGQPVFLHPQLPSRAVRDASYRFQQPSTADIHAFLGHLPSDADRARFSSGNAAALYGLDG
jgi:hypothetical protein